MNDVSFTLQDPTSLMDVPNDCTPLEQEYANTMTKYLLKLNVSSDPNNLSRSHDLSKPCLICKKPGHTFANCKVLNNIEFLKTVFINACIYFVAIH